VTNSPSVKLGNLDIGMQKKPKRLSYGERDQKKIARVRDWTGSSIHGVKRKEE